MPPDPRVEQPYRLTPQLALRLGILGTIVLAVFAVLFLRLWALQILSGSQYLSAAQNNQLRTVRVQPPRGPILDRNGVVLVGNTPGSTVQIWPADLPKEGRKDAPSALGSSLVPVSTMALEIEKRKHTAHPVTASGVSRDRSRTGGRQRVPRRRGQHHLRQYPFRALAAQVLAHVGDVSRGISSRANNPPR